MAVTRDEALRLILDNISPLETEQLSLMAASGRALTNDVVASLDLPMFNNSAMDGFALRYEDCLKIRRIPVVECVHAGAKPPATLPAGCAARVMTGAGIPDGADTVVPFEQVEEADEGIVIHGTVRCGDHIRLKGEDVTSGDTVLKAGSRLASPELAVLAALGYESVSVTRIPDVALLSTGDELLPPGQDLSPGQVTDCNTPAISAAVKSTGARIVPLGIAVDERAQLKNAIHSAAGTDVLITTAGVSAGDRDLVRPVLQDMGYREIFWKIHIKPGYPTAFGLLGKKPVFCLPGNPVSAMMIFEQFIRPALLKMMGHSSVLRPMLSAILKEPMKKKAGRMHMVRVRLSEENGQLVITSAGNQQTGILSTSLQANGVAFLPADCEEFTAGDRINVQLTGEIFHSG
jgi:molybdopterin molybdotransferase